MRQIFSIKKILLAAAVLFVYFAFSSFAYAATMNYTNGVLTINRLNGEADLIHASYTDRALTDIEMISASNGTHNIAAKKGDKFFLWNDRMQPLANSITIGEATEPETSKVLVVHFSATGNTRRVAGYIAAATNADVFELEPIEPYTSADLNWSNSSSRVVYEHDHPEERNVELVSTTVSDWESYDTVFIGYPIWWGIAAWPVDGFVKANDFSGKMVIPFATSSSSGLGESGVLLAEMAGTGEWLEGMRFRSGVSERDVRTWIENLGL